jgi:hypothetical protein
MPLRCWAVVKGESGMLLTGMGMRRGWRSSSALVPAHQCMEAVGAMWPMGPYMCCVHVFWLHVGCMASCGLPWMASAPHSARLHPMAGYGGGPDTVHACDVVLGAGAVSNGRKVGPWTTTSTLTVSGCIQVCLTTLRVRLHPMGKVAVYGGGLTVHACAVVLGAGAVCKGRRVGPWTTTFPPPRKHRTASQCSKGPT